MTKLNLTSFYFANECKRLKYTFLIPSVLMFELSSSERNKKPIVIFPHHQIFTHLNYRSHK